MQALRDRSQRRWLDALPSVAGSTRLVLRPPNTPLKRKATQRAGWRRRAKKTGIFAIACGLIYVLIGPNPGLERLMAVKAPWRSDTA